MNNELSEEEFAILLPVFTEKLLLWLNEQKFDKPLVCISMLRISILYLQANQWDEEQFLTFMRESWRKEIEKD